jgi:hypothetical protein
VRGERETRKRADGSYASLEAARPGFGLAGGRFVRTLAAVETLASRSLLAGVFGETDGR